MTDLTLGQRVMIVYSRLQGSSYSEVLDRYGVDPNIFYRTVEALKEMPISELEKVLDPFQATDLKDCLGNEERYNELFNMGRDYLQQQLEAVQEEHQGKLPYGVTFNKDNAYHLIDIVLHQIKGFGEADRDGKIEKIRDEVIGYNGGAKQYFKDKKLGTLLNSNLFRKPNSPTAALELWDEYQKGDDNPSIFDLEQKKHIRFWEIRENGMWTADNAYKAINYALHQIDGFAEADRKRKVELIDENVVKYPGGTRKFFASYDLDGMLKQAPLRRKNPVAAMEFWDAKYSTDNKSLSLFSETELPYLIIKGGAMRERLKVQYTT